MELTSHFWKNSGVQYRLDSTLDARMTGTNGGVSWVSLEPRAGSVMAHDKMQWSTVRRLALSLCLLVSSAFAASIEGTVRDSASRELASSVLISLEPTAQVAVTDSNGRFMLSDVPPGVYRLALSSPGRENSTRNVLVIGDTVIRLELLLHASPVPLSEVDVSAERTEPHQKTGVGSYRLTRLALDQLPRLGEGDLFRSLAILPGVVTASDFSAVPYVQGGNVDQNLVLLDGVNIYNPTHGAGFFSLFEPDAIGSAELLASGFPAEYGGRLASVLDVRTREGNSERVKGSAGTSLLAARALIEGPFPDDSGSTAKNGTDPKGTYLFAARRSYFDRVLALAHYDLPMYFYDLLGRLSFRYGDKARVNLTGFMTGDQLKLDAGQGPMVADWGNGLATVNWKQSLSPRLNLMNAISFSHYTYNLDIAEFDHLKMKDTVDEWGLRSKVAWSLAGDNELDAGLDLGYSRFRYKAEIWDGFHFDFTGRPFSGAAYVEAALTPLPKLLVQPGARFELYQVVDTNFGGHARVSPRLSVRYSVNEATALKGAYGRNWQFTSSLFPTESPVPGLFFWVPLFGKAQPQEADNFVLGAERRLNPDAEVNLEAYYKRYGRIYTMNENPDVWDIGSLLIPETGYSWGVDVLFNATHGALSGWLSYSLGSARVTYRDDWTGSTLTLPPPYDRRHLVNAVLSYQLPRDFRLTAHWNLGTGFPYTDILYQYRWWGYNYFRDKPYGYWVSVPVSADGLRYPAYHRLDLGAERTFRVGRTKLDIELEIINVYNHKNVLLYYWDESQNPPEKKQVNQLPLLPSLGLKWSF